jgi:hypothetical protein
MGRARTEGLQLPRSVAVLGELGSCVLHNPRTASFFSWRFRAGRVLCLAPDESCMFILRPILCGGGVRPDALAVNAMRLHERFTHRKGDGYYNTFVPPLRRPRFAGELVIIRYSQDKAIVGTDGVTEWEHYFEEPGIAPAYPELWSIGHDQYVIPPGPWRVTERGIEHGRDPRGRALPLFGELS